MKSWKKRLFTMGMAAIAGLALAGCASDNPSEEDTDAAGDNETAAETPSTDPIRMVFYPNESGSELAAARESLADIINGATNREVEIVTTTDYNIAIEDIASGNSQIAFMGAVGYIQANERNDEVQAVLTNSGDSGTLEDAIYYSFIAVRTEDAEDYLVDGDYSLDNLEGKTFSFVSNSSTSGFQVPGTAIVENFGLSSTDELLEEGGFFEQVLFGGSHQGSTTNLLRDDVDAAAFYDADTYESMTLVEGEANTVGAVYEVNEGAIAPYDQFAGESFTLINATPVQNGPFVFNTGELTEEEQAAIIEAFLSDEVANDETIFIPEDAEGSGLFQKNTPETKFVEVDDAWYDPIRNAGN